MQNDKTVLIIGASGLVGTAAANSFLAVGWNVITSSRRTPVLLDGECRHVALNLRDKKACAEAARELAGITHVVYTAVFEKPGVIQGWREADQIETNGEMIRNILDPLSASANLEHVTVLQGTKAYGLLEKQMRIPGRESQPRVVHPNFYWLQEDYIREKSETCGFTFTIFRPQVIVGPNYGVNLNPIPVIGAFAAMRHEEGLPFPFTGMARLVLEATDCDLVGDACVWASTHEIASGETYNLTNGEVFCWSDLWPAFGDAMGVDIGEDESIALVEYFSTRAGLWETITKKHDLLPIPLDALLGESTHYADWVFGYALNRPTRPAFVSTVKIKEAGFQNVYNTEARMCHWLRELVKRKVLPNLHP